MEKIKFKKPIAKIFIATICVAILAGFGALTVQAAPNEAAGSGNSRENQTVQPPTIPRIGNLPSINTQTQSSGDATRRYIFDTFAGKFLGGFLGLCAIASVIFIIVGGLQMLFAFGNEEKVGKAKKTIIWAVAGLVISILAVAIVQIVSNISFDLPARR